MASVRHGDRWDRVRRATAPCPRPLITTIRCSPRLKSARTQPPLARAQSRRYCRRLARRHYENFTVASRLLPRRLAAAFLQYLRLLPLGRRPGRRNRRPAAERWPCWTGGKQQLHDCYAGQTRPPGLHRPGRHHPTIRYSRRPASSICWWPFARTSGSRATRTSANCSTIAATRPTRWAGWCLYLGRCHTPRAGAAVRFDLHRPATGQFLAGRGPRLGPRPDLSAAGRLPPFGYDEAMFARRECNDAFAGCWRPRSTRPKASCGGLPLAQLMPPELQLDVALFVHGGLAILEAIRRQNYDVWTARPASSKRETAAAGPLLVAVAARNPLAGDAP